MGSRKSAPVGRLVEKAHSPSFVYLKCFFGGKRLLVHRNIGQLAEDCLLTVNGGLIERWVKTAVPNSPYFIVASLTPKVGPVGLL